MMANQESKEIVYTIDEKSDDKYYIILVDGSEFCKVSKKNDIETVKNYLKINS